ncbi:hypothetical protein OQA88_10482 [Cercophora sp. LCS_1]
MTPPSTPISTRSRSGERGNLASVYDAVAGRVNVHTTTHGNRTPTTPKSSPAKPFETAFDVRLAPEDVLFRQEGAPTRYAEYDIYWANEELQEGDLPDSDLLKAIHGYASRFYAAAARRTGADEVADEQSMDETALLAFGILLEEAGKHEIGSRGDLIFTEWEEEDDEDERPATKRRRLQNGESSEGEEDWGSEVQTEVEEYTEGEEQSEG